MSEQYWLGPTYEFRCGQWILSAGIPVEEGRLEWLLQRVEDGVETVSHSFALEPHATDEDLTLALGDLPPAVISDLVNQVKSQASPQLLSSGDDEGLA